MAKAILLRNDEHDRTRKTYWVCKTAEKALVRYASQNGREVKTGFSLGDRLRARRATTYASADSVVSVGLAAHESLANVVKSSLIYLDVGLGTDDEDHLASLTRSAESYRNTVRMLVLGERARRAAAFMPWVATRRCDLPPIDLSGLVPAGAAPRLTIVNHLTDAGFARSIVRRFLDSSDFFLECAGLDGMPHNRVRYLDDAAVSDAAASVHIHVGLPADDGERLRILDSWHSGVPVLHLDVGAERARREPQRSTDVRHEYDVLSCHSYEEACRFLALLLDTPALRRLLTANGRRSAAPMAQAWSEIAQDLAA